MNDQRTIADSKRTFHKSFPYVIPALYRRLADELLVELNLLSHQKHFKPDGLFAIGLQKVFNTFTAGYRPEEHIAKLFDSLCTCNGFDPNDLRKKSQITIESLANLSDTDLDKFIIQIEGIRINALNSDSNKQNNQSIYSSRLTSIGILELIIKIQKIDNPSNESIVKEASPFLQRLGLSKDKFEKDIKLFKSNQDKMFQAMELIAEANAQEKRKVESAS